jgi:putative endonuclease
MKQPAVYIMTNVKKGTLYVGVTSDLIKRIYEHKNNIYKGFSSKYNCKQLVFFEMHNTIEYAIAREKKIKDGPRIKKIKLIESMNPDWRDLYNDII